MVPVSWLLFKYKLLIALRFPSDTGMEPVSRLKAKLRLFRFDKLPRVDGMVPDNWFPLKDNEVSVVRFTNESGMEPARSRL